MLTYSRSKDLVCYDVCVLPLSGHGLPSRNRRTRAVADDDRELALALALPGRMDFPLTCQRSRLCTSSLPSTIWVIYNVTVDFVLYLEDSLYFFAGQFISFLDFWIDFYWVLGGDVEKNKKGHYSSVPLLCFCFVVSFCAFTSEFPLRSAAADTGT